MQTPLFDLSLEQHKILFAIAEVTDKLIPESEHAEEVYALLKETLSYLKDLDKTEILFHTYVIKLLTILGFMAPWDHCARSRRKLTANEPLYLNTLEGCVISQAYAGPLDMRLSAPMVKLINFMQKYALKDVMRVKTTHGERQQVWQLLTNMLSNLLSIRLKSEVFLSNSII